MRRGWDCSEDEYEESCRPPGLVAVIHGAPLRCLLRHPFFSFNQENARRTCSCNSIPPLMTFMYDASKQSEVQPDISLDTSNWRAVPNHSRTCSGLASPSKDRCSTSTIAPPNRASSIARSSTACRSAQDAVMLGSGINAKDRSIGASALLRKTTLAAAFSGGSVERRLSNSKCSGTHYPRAMP